MTWTKQILVTQILVTIVTSTLITFNFAKATTLDSTPSISSDTTKDYLPSGFQKAPALSERSNQEITKLMAMSAAAIKLTVISDKKYLNKDRLVDGYFAGDCSASFVSDEGHILLAHHCIEQCLISNRRRIYWDEHRKKESTDDTFYPPSMRQANCQIALNQGHKTISAKVLTASTCNITKKITTLNKSGFSKIKKPYCDRASDLAIIKIDPSEIGGMSACLPLSTQKPRLGDSLMTIGYPLKTYRKDQQNPQAQDSDGHSQYFSTGRIVSKGTCTAIEINGMGQTQLVEKTMPFVSTMGLQTSMDIVPGSSGSVVVNKNGQAIGVASSFLLPLQNEQRQCAGASYIAPLSDLPRVAREWNPKFQLSELKCDKYNLLKHTKTASNP